MKKQFQKISLKDKLYCVKIEVCVGDPSEMHEYIKTVYDVDLKEDLESSEGLQFAITTKHSKSSVVKYFIYLKKKNDYATLGHELIHLIKDIFTDRGLSVDLKKDEEAFCYYFSYLFETIQENLKKPSLTKTK